MLKVSIGATMAKDDRSEGCSAESRTCDGGSGWGPGLGGGGGTPDAGMPTGSSPVGGAAGTGRTPGTGCDPTSADFRDVDNLRAARHFKAIFQVCLNRGGSPNAKKKENADQSAEIRIEGIDCVEKLPDGSSVSDYTVTPTTQACINYLYNNPGA